MTNTAVEARRKLLETELEGFLEVVSTQLQPDQVLLFGSTVEGSVTEWSDLDLVVIVETDLPFHERTRRILDSVSPRVGMDVLVYTPAEWEEMMETRPFIRQEVIAKGRVVYERRWSSVPVGL